MKNYIIVTPSYSKSNGCRVLHTLADYLLKKGYDTSLYSHAPYLDKYNYVTKISEDVKKNTIVVYPEVIVGNPLGFQNVVRWVLYYPGKIAGETSYHHSEKIFTWSSSYYQNVPELNFSFIDKNIFFDDKRPKQHDSYFIHKGKQGRIIPEIENAVRIDMKFPKKREELGELLRNTKTLYSYDANSALLDEALICGAKVKIITDTELIEYNTNFEKSETEINKNFENFINITQAMNYQGEIQQSTTNKFIKFIYFIKRWFAKVNKNSIKVFKYTLLRH